MNHSLQFFKNEIKLTAVNNMVYSVAPIFNKYYVFYLANDLSNIVLQFLKL